MSDVELWCVGEALGLIDPWSIGPLSATSATRISFGGPESNVAIAATRLGLRAGWVGVLGQDPFGRIVRDGIRGEGVTVIARTTHAASTGLMVKERRLEDRVRVTYYRTGSAGSMLGPSDVVALPLRPSSVVHTTGVTMAISESARRAAVQAADLVESVGARLSFDIDHRPGLISPADAAELYMTMVRRAQVVFGSLDEFRLLLGGTPSVDEVIAAVLALGPKEVIIKQGKDGATTGAAEGRWDAAGHPVRVLDRIGAGDAFVAGYLSRRIRGGTIETALEMANSCGALTCMVTGEWEGAPTLQDVALLESGVPVDR
ncbi:sugar kinase [Microbacterium sulfonylureivorans]|uniref:sugar kinase n=1 Tax=Microbacterium sulfonylureivorans TaxID=2486854 RepID=UPI0013DF07DC|nr:sugar kinase [Microbacterium sulfonylureivorans]